MISLFRIVELCEGTVKIDGVDIGSIGTFPLRSKLSIIPQDPVLFSNTVKYNLDPFGSHTEEELWAVLEKVRRDDGWRVSERLELAPRPSLTRFARSLGSAEVRYLVPPRRPLRARHRGRRKLLPGPAPAPLHRPKRPPLPQDPSLRRGDREHRQRDGRPYPAHD